MLPRSEDTPTVLSTAREDSGTLTTSLAQRGVGRTEEPLRLERGHSREGLAPGEGPGRRATIVMFVPTQGGTMLPVEQSPRRVDRAKIDRNLDGTVDEADADVAYDLRFAVLESHKSFSCANLLPALAKDDGILVLGERSGGGSHMVQLRNYPSGPKYGTSGTIMLVNAQGEDIDDGVEPDVALVEGDDYSKLYDLDRIAAEMDAFYVNAA